MTPLQALRTLEIAAELVAEEPQTGQHVRDALNALRGRANRWKLDWLWDNLQVDVKGAPGAEIGSWQNANAALNGIARDLRQERLDPVQLAAAVKRAKG